MGAPGSKDQPCNSRKQGEYDMLRCVSPKGHDGEHCYVVDYDYEQRTSDPPDIPPLLCNCNLPGCGYTMTCELCEPSKRTQDAEQTVADQTTIIADATTEQPSSEQRDLDAELHEGLDALAAQRASNECASDARDGKDSVDNSRASVSHSAPDIVERLRDEADLCRNETADDVARLLDQAADEIERLRRVADRQAVAIEVLEAKFHNLRERLRDVMTSAADVANACPHGMASGCICHQEHADGD